MPRQTCPKFDRAPTQSEEIMIYRNRQIDKWAEIDQEFIASALSRYFGLNKKVAKVLLDYVKDHPNGYGYDVCGSWLKPDRLSHYLYIDADNGLRSQWLDDNSDRGFDQEMKAARDSSLNNLAIFLLMIEENQAHEKAAFNAQKSLQLWDRQYAAKYGSSSIEAANV